MKRILIISVIIVLCYLPCYSDNWLSIEGKYSRVEYLSGNEQIADSLLKLAELGIPRLVKIFELPLQTLQDKKVRIILTGEPDISNGYALADAVVIYERSSDYMLTTTGSKPWYQHVLLHELAHYFTFIKLKRKFNFFGELANLTLPRWFYEGIAQYYTEEWTTFRGDIYLRTAILTGKLTYSALENLDDGRILYAAAHGFIRYLADQYGDSSLIRLMSYNADGWFLDFDAAFQTVYKKSPEAAFTDFIRHLVLYYGDMLAEYPVHSFSNKISFGYRTFEVIPLSIQDSTYIAVVQKSSNHLYRSLILGRIKNGQPRIEQTITHRIHTDAVMRHDKKFLAFGRTNTRIRNNQTSLTFNWILHNLVSGQEEVILKDTKARSATFSPDGNLVLCEIKYDTSRFIEYSITKKLWENRFETSMPVGKFDIAPDGSILFAGQNSAGQRDLYFWQNGNLSQLTNDPEDDRNPIILSDSLVLFNRFEALNPSLGLYNLKNNTHKILLNLQDACWINNYDRTSGLLVISDWDADRNEQFYFVPVDSLLSTNVQPAPFHPKEKYQSWTLKTPEAANVQDLPDTTVSIKNRNKIQFPQGDLIHLFSFALPTYDEKLGLGIYGVTSWVEALQRQAIAGSFILFTNEPNQSLVLLTHALAAFNSTFLSSWYHGPVIFSYQDGRYIDLYQDYLGIEWQHRYFIGGNNRNRFSPSLSFSGYRYDLNEPLADSPDKISYYGPKIGFNYSYLLPTVAYPALAKRQFEISAHYFKSLDKNYNFGIAQIDLTVASNLITEKFGFETRGTWIAKHGNLPGIQTIGIDRFFEFDTPRDFLFTKSIRGIRQDLSGSGLLWQSTELKWFIAGRTNYKLIFLPINNITASLFYDYARIDRSEDIEVSGYGSELSFGEEFYRLGIGYAISSPFGKKKQEQTYIRFNLILPEM